MRSFIALELLGGAAIVAAAWPAAGRGAGRSRRGCGRWLVAALRRLPRRDRRDPRRDHADGTSPRDLYDGMIVQALNVRNVAKGPFPTPDQAVDWGVAALAAAVLTVKLRSAEASASPRCGPACCAAWPG